jgi:hypothetical protein
MRIILAIFLLCYLQISAQLKDSTVRKYFVCESQTFLRSSLVISEGKRILVRDTSGKKLRGRLKILDDSTIVVHNRTTGITDTFNTRIIDKVRRPSMFNCIMGGISTGMSLAMVSLGTVLMFDDNSTIRLLGGIVAFAGGLSTVSSVFVINGKTYRPNSFRYNIVTTKGYKLRNNFPWDIWY